ncbi:MAG TPA: hypothetical protein VKV18_04455 [Chthonomonas sp.]|uniref:LolA family protein n=1 Tax=Chthonomonas sp. TaxID=2282153 RepID=UPI002B4AEF2E|nr:hypothetical protein [Chthonomonas sp.]HLI47927.1 hypothetical protein [Chthonomonas sp.]
MKMDKAHRDERMKQSFLRGVCVLVGSMLLLGGVAWAQTASEIYGKVLQRYMSLHTYEATYLMTQQIPQMGALQLKMIVKMIPKERKAYVVSEPSGVGTGQLAMMSALGQSVSVSDGKEVYLYLKAMNSYMKIPLQETNTQFGGLGMFTGGVPSPAQLKKLGAQLKLLPSTSFDGHGAYVLLMTIRSPHPGVPPVTTKIYIDKATYKVLGSSGDVQSAQGIMIHATMKLLSEKLNPPLPESLFHFTPPPGATEMSGFGGTVGAPQIGTPTKSHKP